MKPRDSIDAQMSMAAVLADAVSVFAGYMLATWLRFDSGWLPILPDRLPPRDVYAHYARGAAAATLLMLFVFQRLQLYVRPQSGRFENRVPRLLRATAIGIVAAMAAAFLVKTNPPYSSVALAVALPAVFLAVTAQRYALFRLELHFARRMRPTSSVLIVGTDAAGARLKRSLEGDPRLRSRVAGFLRTGSGPPPAEITASEIIGGIEDLPAVLDRVRPSQIVLTEPDLPRQKIVEMILLCERQLVRFNIVPDLCRLLTGSVDIQNVGDVPLLGVGQWPLDHFWNRAMKRAEDLLGAGIALLLFWPVIAVAAYLVRRESPGPAFYRQERLGERGRRFTLYKLRTMRVDAERETGPVWARPQDPRRTRLGAWLRRFNVDELPQLWNVLRGDMSLVGPRPERPHFVEQFRDDIQHYMWRHLCKPGMTGWAQVNGLRGDTSIEERIRYDLYYLENWALAFDFKILLRTLTAFRNAY